MTAQVIVISNQKGGTGKTALTFEIGKILSKENRVLFIDLDGQADLTRMLTDEKPLASSLEVLKGEISAKEAVLNINDNISLIPSTDDLLRADNALPSKGEDVSDCLKNAIRYLRKYDYIVIDTPPNLGTLTINALKAADVVYIPTLAENNSIDGVLNFLKTFMVVNRSRKKTADIGGLIVTRYTSRSTINKQMLNNIKKIAEQLNTAVYTVKETVKLREAHYYGKSITEYTPKNAVSKQLVDMVNHLEADY